MESSESNQQSAKNNDDEVITSNLCSEEGEWQSPKGNDAEETPVLEQNLKGNDAEETPSTGHWEECEGGGIPRIGMKFSSEEEAYHYYNAYAAEIGFSIRKGGIRHNTKGVVRQRNFVCSKEGLKVDYGICGVQRGNKLETRTDCKACIRLTVTDGVWEVTYFSPDHNHELAEPYERRFLRSSRRLLEASPITSVVGANTVLYCGDGEGRTPTVGMKVHSEDESYHLYNAYATRIGFSIRKGGYRHNSRGELRQRNYVCSKQGLRVDDDPSRVKKVSRLETRTDCKASIRFTITDGVWVVTYFNPEHNHELADLVQRKYLRSNRKISQANAGTVSSVGDAGIRPIDIHSSLTEEVRGFSNVRIASHDCNQLLPSQRSHMIDVGDAQSLIDHFKHKQAEDMMFFYTVQVDDNNRINKFFWRDGRSRMDYDYFGDVVVFDSSFQSNKYNMVCTPFVGVNHHGKDVLFGGAILSDETVHSLTWLFESFLESMGYKQPKTIFTNQCQAMASAIEKVFPRTCHRLYIWRIQENATQHLSNLYANPEFKTKFNRCLHGCRTEMEFQSTWNELIGGFSLAENEWLKSLYDLRGKWCPAFSLDTFSANMRSSQRSDSMKNVFNHNTCKTMTLTQFVHRYEETAEKMRLAELEEDCNQGLPKRASRNSGMLKQAADVYTIELFTIFQEEMVESLSMVMNELSSNGTLHCYGLTEECHDGGYNVHFNSDDCTVACSCKMFESMGLLCRHALRVLNMRNVTKIPAQYIMRRWTKWARKGTMFPEHGESSLENAKSSRSLLRSRLLHKAFCAVEKSLMTTKGSEIVDARLDQIIDQAENQITTSNVLNIDNEVSGEFLHDGTINDAAIKHCSFNSASDESHARSSQMQKKRKRKAPKSNISPGQQKQQSIIGSAGALFHPPQVTAFIRPFPPPIVGMDARSYMLPTLHQGNLPTWVLGNFRPASALQGADQVAHATQDLSYSFNASNSEVPQLDQGKESS